MGQRHTRSHNGLMTTFNKQVILLLINPNEPTSRCCLRLAHDLASIINGFTGNHIIENCKKLKWPESMVRKIESDAFSSRRTRLMDRIVRYGEAASLSDAEIYTCFYAISPFVDEIMLASYGQEWESVDDWQIYDIYAKFIVLCGILDPPPNAAKDLNNEINHHYEAFHAQQIKIICENIENHLRNQKLIFSGISFGNWLTMTLEHFCEIAVINSSPEAIRNVTNTAHMLLQFSFMHPKLWFHDPFTLCCAAVNSAATFLGAGTWGSWYRVLARTAVRHGILLDSPTISLLEPGEVVHMVQQFGRRVLVDLPYRGFCSLHDGAGLQILQELPNNDLLSSMTGWLHAELQSPYRDMMRWIFTNRTGSYRSLKEKYAKKERCEVSTFVFHNGQLCRNDAME